MFLSIDLLAANQANNVRVHPSIHLSGLPVQPVQSVFT
jgi:hypothetical protein